jgi:hypothetical protein
VNEKPALGCIARENDNDDDDGNNNNNNNNNIQVCAA